MDEEDWEPNDPNHPIVRTEYGRIRGLIKNDKFNGTFYSFQGIPYAVPPVNEWRFKAPRYSRPWPGVYDAFIERPPCYQYDVHKKDIVGSEDCLYLNVYTKRMPTPNTALLPVMVFIHGGYFTNGSGNWSSYSPEFFLHHNIVLVTFNYRVGLLGFLAIDSPFVPMSANNGLKDISLALEWVHSNIVHFNGNFENITIFGECAGAAAVHYMLLSSRTEKYFRKAILQSGSALCPWALGKYCDSYTWKAGGLAVTNPVSVFRILQRMPVKELFELQTRVRDLIDPCNRRYFCPVVERQWADRPFLSKEPLDIILDRAYRQVPLIIGYTSMEGIFAEFLRCDRTCQIFERTEASVPYMFRTVQNHYVTEQIKEFYLKGKDVEVALDDDVYKLFGDTMFLIGIFGALNAHLNTSRSPIYLYRFDTESRLNIIKSQLNVKTPGASHADDLGYFFNTINTPFYIAARERKAIDLMLKLWVNFAIHDDPTPASKMWQPTHSSLGAQQLNILEIHNTRSTLCTELDEDEKARMKFWINLFNIDMHDLFSRFNLF